MGDNQGKTVLLSEPIEFLIFNQIPITCSFGETSPVHGYIEDSTDNDVLINIAPEDRQNINTEPGGEIRVSCNYRAKRLEFVLKINGHDAASGLIRADIPHQGQLVNYRVWERTQFDHDAQTLQAEVTIETLLGRRSFKTSEFSEFSYQSLSLFIDRNQGIIVPNDVVTSITIKSRKQTIFQGTGKVTRIENIHDKADTLYIVVKLDDPNYKPVLDIEPNKRQSDRFVFENRSDAFIEFTHPFSKVHKMALMYDVSNSGISIIMQGSKYAMPIGLMIEKASMQLPLHPRLEVSLLVKGYYQEEAADNTLKVCMEFVNASAMLVKEVSNFVQHKLSTHLLDATYEDIEELWYFYFETGFIYKDKRRQLQENSETVKNTFRALLKSNTPLIKKILYKEDGVIKGHVTAIKVFDQTLMVQHLNALKTNSGPAAMHVIRAITSYFMDSKANDVSGSRYICFYYRPNNFYPNLVFGSAVKLIDNPDLCWIDTYQFCLPAPENKTEAQDPDIDVYEAQESDLVELENILIDEKDFRIMRLEGMVRETMADMSLSKSYEDIGLYRYRKIIVAKNRSTGQSVYAACTYGSPGLNFSELTNSIKLFYASDTRQKLQQMIDSVCDYALKTYENTDVRNPALLLKSDQPAPACFEIEKNYTLFALDVRHTKKFRDATEHVFANFKEFVRNQKQKAN
ncbi:MAG: hypothetical protein GC149_10280 [Gammaproteobacteria bacterium]|nr:hypothetical protein [Gammaproteobacteria bacterium]